MESRVSQRRRMRDARTSRMSLIRRSTLITRNALNRLTIDRPCSLSTRQRELKLEPHERQREGGGSPLSSAAMSGTRSNDDGTMETRSSTNHDVR